MRSRRKYKSFGYAENRKFLRNVILLGAAVIILVVLISIGAQNMGW